MKFHKILLSSLSFWSIEARSEDFTNKILISSENPSDFFKTEMRELLSLFPESQAVDSEFFAGLVTSLSSAYEDLRASDFEGLLNLEIESMRDPVRGVKLEDYLKAVVKFQKGLEFLDQKIAAIEAFAQTWNINARGNREILDVSVILRFARQGSTDIRQKAEKLVFNLALPNQSMHRKHGIEVESLQEMNLYSANALIELRAKAAALRIMRTTDRRAIDASLNRFTLQKIRTFIRAFGETERYRDPASERVLTIARQDLEELMWARSYLRAVYGIKLGSFGVFTEGKFKFNLDMFASLPMQLIDTPLYNENELTEMQDLLYVTLASQEGKSKEVLSRSTPFFVRIASAISFFEGTQKWAKINAEVVRFLIADGFEELLIGRAGGLRDMRAHYRARYYANLENEIYFKGLAARYMPTVEAKDDFEADLGSIDTDSMLGVMNVARSLLENHEDRIEEANRILAIIEALTIDSEIKGNRKKRRDI